MPTKRERKLGSVVVGGREKGGGRGPVTRAAQRGKGNQAEEPPEQRLCKNQGKRKKFSSPQGSCCAEKSPSNCSCALTSRRVAHRCEL